MSPSDVMSPALFHLSLYRLHLASHSKYLFIFIPNTVCMYPSQLVSSTSLLGPQRFVEIFAHNYQMGSEPPADLDFVFVAFQESDPNNDDVS